MLKIYFHLFIISLFISPLFGAALTNVLVFNQANPGCNSRTLNGTTLIYQFSNPLGPEPVIPAYCQIAYYGDYSDPQFSVFRIPLRTGLDPYNVTFSVDTMLGVHSVNCSDAVGNDMPDYRYSLDISYVATIPNGVFVFTTSPACNPPHGTPPYISTIFTSCGNYLDTSSIQYYNPCYWVRWFDPDGLYIGQNLPSISPSKFGTYTLEATSNMGRCVRNFTNDINYPSGITSTNTLERPCRANNSAILTIAATLTGITYVNGTAAEDYWDYTISAPGMPNLQYSGSSNHPQIFLNLSYSTFTYTVNHHSFPSCAWKSSPISFIPLEIPSDSLQPFVTSNRSCTADPNGAISLTPAYPSVTFPYLNVSWYNEGQYYPSDASGRGISGINGGVWIARYSPAWGCNLTAAFTVSRTADAFDILDSNIIQSSCNTLGIEFRTIPVIDQYRVDIGGSIVQSGTVSSPNFTISGLPPSTAQITFTKLGCEFLKPFVLTLPHSPYIGHTTTTYPAPCANLNGTLSLNIDMDANTNPPLNITVFTGLGAWVGSYPMSNPGVLNVSLPPLGYNFAITHPNMCPIASDFSINGPPPLVITLNSVQDSISCTGTGSIDVTVSGGVGPYSTTPPALTNLLPGNYTIVATDKNLCIQSQKVQVKSLPAFTVGTVTQVDFSCGAIGSLTLPITINAGNLTATLYNLGTPLLAQTVTFNTDVVFNIPTPGSYTVSVNHICSSVNLGPYIFTSPEFLFSSISVANASSCGVGSISGSMSHIGYSLVLTDSASKSNNFGPFTTKTFKIGSLTAGTYTLQSSVPTGCASSQFSFTIYNAPSVTITQLTPTSPSCASDSDGQIDVFFAGGISPYTPIINGAPASKFSVVSATQLTLTSLSSGTYSISIKDATACPSATSTATILPTPQVQASIDSSSISPSTCGGISPTGTATVTLKVDDASGYSYIWSDSSDPLPASRTGLVAGTYSVYGVTTNAKTGKKCVTSTATAVIPATGSSDLAVTNPSTTPAPSCIGASAAESGSLSFQISGGVPPFSINVTGASQITAKFFWSATAESNRSVTVSIPQSGAYTIVVGDSVGCSLLRTVTVQTSTIQPDKDSDGVCDDSDNCPTVFNPSQLNSDNDNFGGDACDICPFDPLNLNSDGDLELDCNDGCPFVAGMYAPTVCGCFPVEQCNCNLSNTCVDLTYNSTGDNTTSSIGGGTPSVTVGTVDDLGGLFSSKLDWLFLREVDSAHNIINSVDMAMLNWSRAVYATNTSISAIFSAKYVPPWAPNCTLNVQLSNLIASANSSQLIGNISFQFASSANKFSLSLSGCWGFSDTNNSLEAAFLFSLPGSNATYVPPPTDCNGHIADPGETVSIAKNSTNTTSEVSDASHDTISFYTSNGGIVQSQILTLSSIDGITKNISYAVNQTAGVITLIFSSFVSTLNYDPTLSLLFGDNGTSRACEGIFIWLGPAIAFGVAIALSILIIFLILYFPPATRLFFGNEGLRVQNVRSSSRHVSASNFDYDPEVPTSSPSFHQFPPTELHHTTADW